MYGDLLFASALPTHELGHSHHGPGVPSAVNGPPPMSVPVPTASLRPARTMRRPAS